MQIEAVGDQGPSEICQDYNDDNGDEDDDDDGDGDVDGDGDDEDIDDDEDQKGGDGVDVNKINNGQYRYSLVSIESPAKPITREIDCCPRCNGPLLPLHLLVCRQNDTLTLCINASQYIFSVKKSLHVDYFPATTNCKIGKS